MTREDAISILKGQCYCGDVLGANCEPCIIRYTIESASNEIRNLKHFSSMMIKVLETAEEMRPWIAAQYGNVPAVVMDFCHAAKVVLSRVYNDKRAKP